MRFFWIISLSLVLLTLSQVSFALNSKIDPSGAGATIDPKKKGIDPNLLKAEESIQNKTSWDRAKDFASGVRELGQSLRLQGILDKVSIAEHEPGRETKIFEEALRVKKLAKDRYSTHGLGGDHGENDDLERTIARQIGAYLGDKEVQLKTRFDKMKVLKVPEAQKRIQRLANFFLKKMREAELLRARPSLAKGTKRTPELAIREALYAYEEAVMQANKTEWTWWTLRNFIISEIEQDEEISSSANLTGSSLALGVANFLGDPVFVSILSSTIAFFSDPTNLFAATVEGGAGGVAAKFLKESRFRYMLASAIGVVTIPIARQIEINRYKKNRDNHIPVPQDLVLAVFWTYLKNYGYEVPKDNDKRANTLKNRLEEALGGRPLCEVFLAEDTGTATNRDEIFKEIDKK